MDYIVDQNVRRIRYSYTNKAQFTYEIDIHRHSMSQFAALTQTQNFRLCFWGFFYETISNGEKDKDMHDIWLGFCRKHLYLVNGGNKFVLT